LPTLFIVGTQLCDREAEETQEYDLDNTDSHSLHSGKPGSRTVCHVH
jgi:hypothetical protein